MAFATGRQLISPQIINSNNAQLFTAQVASKSRAFTTSNGNYNQVLFPRLCLLVSGHRISMTIAVMKASPRKDGVVSADDQDGVSLGTMKLPLDIDIPRFETLLFQWANSLSQGAQLPLPVPLKVDKIEGGVRLGFATIEDGKTQVDVYIDCLVIPGSSDSSAPIFRAIRNGALKEKVPPGEPRIMKSLLAALNKSAELARL